jgi:hypothetical protein
MQYGRLFHPYSVGTSNKISPLISDIHQVWEGAKDCDLHQK